MTIQWPSEFPGAHYLDEKEEAAVLDVLRQGSLFRYYGLKQPRYVDALEAAACQFYGADYALGINSGTGALTTAMTALGIGPGCEVILPAFLWVATVGAVVQQNAIPVLCEIDDSFTMDPHDLAQKITPRTRLIVPIHMAGVPCAMDPILKIARAHHIPVLEDCAQCNGGTYHGQKLGTLGAIGIFSLQLNKNMTSGEGGLLITNDEKLYHKAFSAHDMGLVRIEGRLADPEPYALTWGAGRRMAELCGAVASVQITKLPAIVEHMRASHARIKAQLHNLPDLTFRRLNDPDGATGPFLVFTLPDQQRAQTVAQKMIDAGLHNVFRIADYGLHIYCHIPSLVQKIPLSPAGNPWKLPANADSNYHYHQGACPVTDDLIARSILLPVPSCLTTDQEDAAAQIVRQAVTA